MKKHLLALSCILMLLTTLLTACGGDGGTTSNGPVTLTYALWGKSQVPAMEQIISEFKKTHPNVDVKIELTAFKDYFTKLETTATGGTIADVFWMNGPNFVKYAANDVIMPLDDQIKSDKIDLNNYPSALVNMYSYNGKHYALPKDFDTIALWYNKKLFDDAGVKYPDETWTWDTFREAAKKLTNPAKGIWGAAAPEEDQGGFYNTIPQAGGYVISPDRKTSGFDKPEAIEGLKFWTNLIQDKSSPTLAQMTDTTPGSLFTSGKLAMFYDGSWSAIDYSQNEYTKDKVDVAVLPKGKQRATVIHGLGNAIYSQTKHPKEAWEFLKFLGSKEAADIQAKTGAVIPAYNGTQDAWVKAYPSFKVQAYIDELQYAVSYPVSKNTSAWTKVQNDVLSKVWAGQLSVEDGAKQLGQQMNQLLAKE